MSAKQVAYAELLFAARVYAAHVDLEAVTKTEGLSMARAKALHHRQDAEDDLINAALVYASALDPCENDD